MHLRQVDPTYRTSTGLTLVQLALNGYDGAQSTENEQPPHFEVANWLLRNGVDINSADPRFGFTALHDAVFQNKPEVISFLLSHGANTAIRCRLKIDGVLKELSPLELARQMQRSKSLPNYSSAAIENLLTMY